MNNMRELLKEQLDSAEPCNGDYLNGKTIEDYLAVATTMEDPRSAEEIRESVGRLIEDYRVHQGEKKLYVMEQTADCGLRVLAIWESEIEKYTDRKLLRVSGKFPVFEGVVE